MALNGRRTLLLATVGAFLLPVTPQLTCPSTGQAMQVHLTPAGANSVYVNYASTNSSAPSRVLWGTSTPPTTYAYGTLQTTSQLNWYQANLISPTIGPATLTQQQLADLEGVNVSKVQTGVAADYTLLQSFYNSPALNRVQLSGLSYGVKYYYQVEGCSTIFSFTIPSPTSYPFTLALSADLDFTPVSQVNLNGLLTANANIFLIAGDLSYADGYGPRWDSFGRFIEPLAASVVTITVGGNHEVQYQENWGPYNARFPMPSNASGSPDNTYFSYNMGPVHFIGLNSYADTTPNATQGTWLQADIATVNRTITPWIIALWHTPWYTSNSAFGQAAKMISDFESIIYKAGVDVVISGHNHQYERSSPVYNYSIDPCGPTHLITGDGGTRGGLDKGWIFPQPSYSAFRQASFGYSQLVIYNSTYALVTRTKTCCEGYPNRSAYNCTQSCVDPKDTSNNTIPVDSFWIIRNLSCANKLYTGQSTGSSTTTTTTPNTTTTTTTTDNSAWVIATGVLAGFCGVFLLTTLGLLYALYAAKASAAYEVEAIPDKFLYPVADPTPTPV